MPDKLKKRGLLNTFILGKAPSYNILDSFIDNKKELYLFIDFNNNIKGIYYPEMLEYILDEIKRNNGIFPSILINEWILYQTYLEKWAISRNVKLHTIYFAEGGQSYYHKNLYKGYKGKRVNAAFKLPIETINQYNSSEDIQVIIQKFLESSWKWIEILSKKSNILSIRLNNLDADFIPELLIRNFGIFKDEANYVIMSTDGDMIQSVDYGDNIFIYDGNMLISNDNWLYSKSYFKKGIEILTEANNSTNTDNIDDINNISISADKIILFKAIVGDTSDSIPGIKGVGPVNFFKNFIHMIPDDVRADDIEAIKKICYNRRSDSVVCAKIVNNSNEFEKMIRLVSFKYVILWLTQNYNRYSAIKSIINENINSLKEKANILSLYKQEDPDTSFFFQNSNLNTDNI